ncbi:hypothetical protein H9P43_007671 [Blastocladiella emersonii ATCC 22665]|nr:hypothetical protein H9P43_007671 [Blastocladiella emersonii ATCC 22665]
MKHMQDHPHATDAPLELPFDLFEHVVALALPRAAVAAASAAARDAATGPHALRPWVARRVAATMLADYEAGNGEDYDAGYFSFGRDLDKWYELARHLQMPLVWFLKLRFSGALRNDTPGLRGGDDSAVVAARTGHPFSPSVAAYFYRRTASLSESLIEAIAPFCDLPMGTDLLHGSFAFRAVPEGLSLIHFFLHVGDLDAMFACLDHLLTLFPASLRTDRAKITTWSRFWLSERSITRENLCLMDEDDHDDPPVDISYPVTFPMALALAAMTVWNRKAVERLLDGDFGIDRTELFAWFSRRETTNVFLCTLHERHRAAETIPPILDWLVGEGWVRDRERHASMSYYAWDHADYALFKVLFERYDLPLLDEMDAETRFDVGAGLAPFLDEGHHDQIPRFAELGIITNEAWTGILTNALETPKVLEPVLGYLETYVDRSDLRDMLSNACVPEDSSWPATLTPDSFLALINVCGALGFAPAQILESHLDYYASLPGLVPLLLSADHTGVEPRDVLERVLDSLATFEPNYEGANKKATPFLTEVLARTCRPEPPIPLDAFLDCLDCFNGTRCEVQTVVIALLVEQIIDLLDSDRSDDDDDEVELDGSDDDDAQPASALFNVLDQLTARYPHGFGRYDSEVTASLRGALREHFSRDALAAMDGAALVDPSTDPLNRRLFDSLVEYDITFMAQFVKDVRGFDIPWVLELLFEMVSHPSDLNVALPRATAESMIRRAILDGQYDHACRVMHLAPPSDKFKSSLAYMVKAKKLHEAQEKVLDVFGIKFV